MTDSKPLSQTTGAASPRRTRDALRSQQDMMPTCPCCPGVKVMIVTGINGLYLGCYRCRGTWSDAGALERDRR